jgi:hypothetical protein
MDRMEKARLLKEVYDGKGTALDALARLARSSSSVQHAYRICTLSSRGGDAGAEALAMHFVTYRRCQGGAIQ